MQANPRTLDALFNSQIRYVVPMFQRLYVWQENPQWATLWEDVAEKAVLQIKGNTVNAHYLGALIIEGVRPSSPREVKRFLIIDGQQRLTTLQILLCAYRDVARKHEWTTLDRTLSRYLENADADVMEKPDEEMFKLWPTALNREVFRGVLTAASRGEVERRFPLVRIGRRRKPEPRNNLVEAYLYFSTSIEAWIQTTAAEMTRSLEDVAFTLLQALQQDFCVVEISLSEGDDSQEIFYSLNSQGRPLSQSDLLRSLIFMRAEKERLNRDEIFAEYWARFETAFWSAEEKRGGRTYSRLDLGLRYFLMAKTGRSMDARRVNEEYRHWVSEQPPRYPSVKAELADFSRYGDRYEYYESTQASSLPSTDLRRVLKDFDVSTAMPLVLFLELDAELAEEEKAACLSAIDSFLARRVITGDETKEYNLMFVEVVGAIHHLRGQAVLPGLRQKLLGGRGTTRRWPTDGEVVEAVISRPMFTAIRKPALRLILERLELESRSKKSESTDITPGLQIEHVLPQRWAAHWPLEGRLIPPNIANYPYLAQDELAEFSGPIRRRNHVIHTLGNLTLLNEYLNPAASNGPFPLKLIEYRNSVLQLNRYFGELSEWNEDSIAKRAQSLGEAICRIWPRPAS